MTEPGTLPEGIGLAIQSEVAVNQSMFPDDDPHYLTSMLERIAGVAMAEGAAQERARHDWQLIDTAPENEQVWAWDDERGSNPAMLVDGVWLITYDDAEINPTHWMPMPKQPLSRPARRPHRRSRNEDPNHVRL